MAAKLIDYYMLGKDMSAHLRTIDCETLFKELKELVEYDIDYIYNHTECPICGSTLTRRGARCNNHSNHQ